MNNEGSPEIAFPEIAFMVIIAARDQRDALLTALGNQGIHNLTNTFYGRGTVDAGLLMNTLGFIPDKSKVVISCVSTCKKIDSTLKMLTDEFKFDKPHTGVAFTLPVDKVLF